MGTPGQGPSPEKSNNLRQQTNFTPGEPSRILRDEEEKQPDLGLDDYSGNFAVPIFS